MDDLFGGQKIKICNYDNLILSTKSKQKRENMTNTTIFCHHKVCHFCLIFFSFVWGGGLFHAIFFFFKSQIKEGIIMRRESNPHEHRGSTDSYEHRGSTDSQSI